MSESINWRILVIEDDETIAAQLIEAIPRFAEEPDTAEGDLCKDFKEGAAKLKIERYDLIILDLKDDNEAWDLADEDSAGLKIFEELKKTRFIPVVFYTAHAHQVRSFETSFVRVVEKTETTEAVKNEVRRVLHTNLPALTKRVEEIQRSYMWDFVGNHWKDFEHSTDQADIAYLLARRLAISLEAAAGELAVKAGGSSEAPVEQSKVHPMIMYVVPPLGPHPLAGDIVSETVSGVDLFWMILTPSCDFAQSKATHVILAKCEQLVDGEEYKKWAEGKTPPSTQRLEQLVEDKRGDRYKFLPRTFFIPDLVVDFQQLRSIVVDSLKTFKPIATLDSPFAESVLARFARYFNRLGTPDLDKAVVFNRLEAALARTRVDSAEEAPSGEPTQPSDRENIL
jgi:CheY-like chemotaxis protein